jgi:hypothetical protein
MVIEITSEILFEEHAAVYEHVLHEIALVMNIPLDEVELVNGNKIGVSNSHLLKFHSINGFSAIIIHADELANIPTWPLSIPTDQKIKNALLSPLVTYQHNIIPKPAPALAQKKEFE